MADDDVRAKAAELVKRAEEDRSFAERAKADPRAALAEVGLSADMLESVDARIIRVSCNDFTCFSSACPGTCYVTFCHTTYRVPDRPIEL